MENTAAILLRKTRFSDTSLIVSWLTEQHGRIKTMAKGALRPKSTFAGRLDLFFFTEISVARSSRSEIHILKEVALLDPLPGLRQQYARTEMAAYWVELLELCTEPDHPVPELYDLLHRGLLWLNTAEPDRKALLHFEKQLAGLIGIQDPRSTPAAVLQRHLGKLPLLRKKLV